ncbi:MAG: hypothetical protein WAV41_03615 [Microgenomates group bacterium]
MKLFPSTLVINGNHSEISKILSTLGHQKIENNPDIFAVGEYTIASIREINKFLSQKPLAHDNKVVLITNSDNLQKEAQNALLKNLEEPGPHNYFILTTSRPHSLLATIISRCHILHCDSPHLDPEKILAIPSDPSTQLTLSDSLASDKLSTISYLENQLHLFQQELTKNPSLKNSQTIKKIIKSIALIKANVDPKTALDFLMLS